MSLNDYIWHSTAKISGAQKFRVLAEISVIFTPDGAFFRKMSKNFEKCWKIAFFQKHEEFVTWSAMSPKWSLQDVFSSKVVIWTNKTWLIFEMKISEHTSCTPPQFWQKKIGLFFKNNFVFHVPVVCKYPFVGWRWRRMSQDAPDAIWSRLDVFGGS